MYTLNLHNNMSNIFRLKHTKEVKIPYTLCLHQGFKTYHCQLFDAYQNFLLLLLCSFVTPINWHHTIYLSLIALYHWHCSQHEGVYLIIFNSLQSIPVFYDFFIDRCVRCFLGFFCHSQRWLLQTPWLVGLTLSPAVYAAWPWLLWVVLRAWTGSLQWELLWRGTGSGSLPSGWGWSCFGGPSRAHVLSMSGLQENAGAGCMVLAKLMESNRNRDY